MILEQDSALIKNFITKKDPSMEFNEMQAIIKMLYETYLATQKMKGEELGLCLRMLYAEGVQAIVETVRNSKGKIEFHIKANTDEALLRDLIERYNILIS